MGIAEIVGGAVLLIVGLNPFNATSVLSGILAIINGMAFIFFTYGSRAGLRSQDELDAQRKEIKKLETRISELAEKTNPDLKVVENTNGGSLIDVDRTKIVVGMPVQLMVDKPYSFHGKDLLLAKGTVGTIEMSLGDTKVSVLFQSNDGSKHKLECDLRELCEANKNA